ncbi:hypothetical protein KM043_014115 [Ampulex compressa]|nr:hypothetical protein KM043_014115 [Ampulex compressa]
MLVPLSITLLWIITILWSIYLWYSDISQHKDYNQNRKIAYDLNHDNNERSTTSVESSDMSESEDNTSNSQRMKYEVQHPHLFKL